MKYNYYIKNKKEFMMKLKRDFLREFNKTMNDECNIGNMSVEWDKCGDATYNFWIKLTNVSKKMGDILDIINKDTKKDKNKKDIEDRIKSFKKKKQDNVYSLRSDWNSSFSIIYINFIIMKYYNVIKY
jgi:ATP-dependent Lon protease